MWISPGTSGRAPRDEARTPGAAAATGPGQAGGPCSHTGQLSGDTGTEHTAAAVRPHAQVHTPRTGHTLCTHALQGTLATLYTADIAATQI